MMMVIFLYIHTQFVTWCKYCTWLYIWTIHKTDVYEDFEFWFTVYVLLPVGWIWLNHQTKCHL